MAHFRHSLNFKDLFSHNFRHKINKAGIREGQSRLPLVLDCSHISTADFTAANGFKAMITDFRKRNQPIIFYNTSPSVIDTFLGVNIEEFVVVHSLEELNEHLRGKFLVKQYPQTNLLK